MSDVATPRDLARESTPAGIDPSDGPTGDLRLNEVCERLGRSVDALIDPSAERQGVAGDIVVGTTAMEVGEPDAGDVVTRAHEAQEALQARLREAQA